MSRNMATWLVLAVLATLLLFGAWALCLGVKSVLGHSKYNDYMNGISSKPANGVVR